MLGAGGWRNIDILHAKLINAKNRTFLLWHGLWRRQWPPDQTLNLVWNAHTQDYRKPFEIWKSIKWFVRSQEPLTPNPTLQNMLLTRPLLREG